MDFLCSFKYFDGRRCEEVTAACHLDPTPLSESPSPRSDWNGKVLLTSDDVRDSSSLGKIMAEYEEVIFKGSTSVPRKTITMG